MTRLCPLQKPIVIGKILTAHGVQGQLKIQSMMDNPIMLQQMTPFWIQDRCFDQWSFFKPTGKKDIFLGKLHDITTMNDALLLRHALIMVDRSQLPEMDHAVYYVDLERKPVIDCHGVSMGIIHHVHDFGAGPVLELAPSGHMVSFHMLVNPGADILELKISAEMLA